MPICRGAAGGGIHAAAWCLPACCGLDLSRRHPLTHPCAPCRPPCLHRLQAQVKQLDAHTKQLEGLAKQLGDLAAGATPFQQVSGCACLPRGSGWRELRGCMALA